MRIKKMELENRQKYNKEILEILSEFIEEHPEMRFIQALWALDIVSLEDRFYEEPSKTLDKVKLICYNRHVTENNKKGNNQ